MVTNEKFRFEQVMKDGKRTVILRGVIDEDTTFDDLLKLSGPIVFNFRAVSQINSCGIRNWVNFIKQMEGKQISYEECPPLVVRQMNMVPSFIGGAVVDSVFVPYVCDNCEEEKLVLVPQNRFEAKNALQESFPCEHCKQGEMELDGHPKQYFAFAA